MKVNGPNAMSLENNIKMIPLAQLRLDPNNPRFGRLGKRNWDQADILDHIVETFGIDDVLSSIAINGYISAEPLVCRQESDPNLAIVVEGNRRLAACLIITGDARASRQKTRTSQYRDIWQSHGAKSLDPLPVILFNGIDRQRAIMSYLGVRHIASAQPWDSYAKAAWVAQIVDENHIELSDVALMIGDQHRTIQRLLEGYYFIHQAMNSGVFEPQNSQRRGRGSVTEYPFSWIYTILGYSTTRSFLGLSDRDPKKDLIEEKNISHAGVILRAMFGDRSKGRSAAIEDSREIGALAATFNNPDKVAMLEAGKSVSEIQRATRPIDERVREGLIQVKDIQADIVSSMSGEEIAPSIAESLVSVSKFNRRTADDIAKRISRAAQETDDE